MAQFRDRPIPAPEPPPIDDGSPQWDHYDDTTLPPMDYIPPATPPAGRQYMAYRQPPSWQHADIAGVDGMGSAFGTTPSALAGMFHVAAGAGIGYWFTREWRGAAAGGLAVLGAGQLPSLSDSKRLLFGVACLGAAYYLAKEPGAPLFATANDEVPATKKLSVNRRWMTRKNTAVRDVKTPWMKQATAPWAQYDQPDDDDEDDVMADTVREPKVAANRRKPGRR